MFSGEWIAVSVRASGLATRRIGRAAARRIAETGSLPAAVEELARTPYGRDVRPGMDLAAGERAVWSTLLWHLRVLAGWAPQLGMDRVRLLAGGFEIANILGLLASFTGRPAAAPFALGALTTIWPTLAQAAGPDDVRRLLSRSAWGDPGGSDPGTVAVGLQAAWARRVAYGVPEARRWAAFLTGTLLARITGEPGFVPADQVARNLRLVARSRARTEAVATAADLWRAEARGWDVLEEDAVRLRAGRRPGPAAVVAAAGLLAADAWRARAALQLAAHGAVEQDELDVVA